MNPEKKRRGMWTQDNLTKAINEVRHKGLSVNAASQRYDIPRRTLRRYLEANKGKKSKLGCNTTITIEQEEELCRRIFRLAEVGFPLTSKLLRLNVFRFCHENGIPNRFSKGHAGRYWLKGFLARNPEVRRRKAQRLNPARAQKLNKFIVADHFEKLKKILSENNLLNFPEKIFNMDEKGCRLQLHKDPEVFAKKGSKRVHIVAKEHGESVTIVACGNAIGSAIPPMILFSGVRKNPAWERDLPTGSVAKMTPKGCMTSDTFVEFLRHFSRFKPNGTCLLIFDGAKSHLDYKICEFAEDNDILLYCLPSNTTHELQPLDKGCFRSFELFWDQHALLHFDTHKEEQVISRLNFSDVFTPTWEKSMTHANLKSGFRATGIYPFNPHIIPEEAFAPSTATEQPPPNTDNLVPRTTPEQQPSNSHPHVVAGSSGLQSKVRQQHLRRDVSSSSDSDNSEVLDEPSGPSNDSDNLGSPEAVQDSSHTSFTEMLSTPKKRRKITRVMKPAVNSRGVLLKKGIFEDKKEDNKNDSQAKNKKVKDATKSGDKMVPKKTSKKKKSDSWYCAICDEDEVKDMRLCGECGIYVHEECVGLTKEDKELFICPKCLH